MHCSLPFHAVVKQLQLKQCETIRINIRTKRRRSRARGTGGLATLDTWPSGYLTSWPFSWGQTDETVDVLRRLSAAAGKSIRGEINILYVYASALHTYVYVYIYLYVSVYIDRYLSWKWSNVSTSERQSQSYRSTSKASQKYRRTHTHTRTYNFTQISTYPNSYKMYKKNPAGEYKIVCSVSFRNWLCVPRQSRLSRFALRLNVQWTVSTQTHTHIHKHKQIHLVAVPFALIN